MEIRYSLALHPKVVKDDLPRIDNAWRIAIREAVREKLQTEPEFYGKPLRQHLKGCRKLRVGDYRIVFQIQGKKVLILAIQHRSVVYGSEVQKRKKSA
jgi:mRNA interferase RelE/StbE